jgi:hypothetical protein
MATNFRFTIREVLLLTATVALILGWVADHGHLATKAWLAEKKALDAQKWKNRHQVLAAKLHNSGWNVSWVEIPEKDADVLTVSPPLPISPALQPAP